VQLVPQQRQLNQGFGDALAKAFEFAVTVGIFFVIGFLLDRWLGTTPLFMIVLSVFVVIGQTVRLWYAYDAQMRKHEDERRATISAGGRGPER
jgi:F0F1-type ATP synthase assembly protein I